jgi:hypothetical protein
LRSCASKVVMVMNYPLRVNTLLVCYMISVLPKAYSGLPHSSNFLLHSGMRDRCPTPRLRVWARSFDRWAGACFAPPRQRNSAARLHTCGHKLQMRSPL